MENHIPYRDSGGAGSNPALAAIMLSDRMRTIIATRIGKAQDLYQDIVAKRTGRLAASARVETFIGGQARDRWYGRLIVGETITYGASHEFGYDNGDTHIGAAAHDLNQVLNMLGSA